MSGPNYPHPNPAPGSNAIGSFQIGVSPIGDVPPFDVWTTILAQYANSPIISGLCVNMSLYVDPTRDFDGFFDTIWNIDSAVGVGLDIWGRILGVSRVLNIGTGTNYFGFEEQGALAQPFGFAPFYSGQAVTNNFSLDDVSYRRLLLAKAFANICDGSIDSINALLLTLFPNRGNCYVQDNLDLTLTYVFKFILTPVEAAIVEQSGVLPRTSGVTATVEQDY